MSLRLTAVSLLFASAVSAHAADAPRYTLRYDARDTTMQVELCLPRAAASVRFAAGDASARHLDAITRDSGAPVSRAEGAWLARNWRARECLHYRAALGELAAEKARHGRMQGGDDLVVDPSNWLLQVDGAGDAEARVQLPPGYAISTPWRRIEGTDRYTIPHTPDDWMARVAIGRFSEQAIVLAGGTLHVAILHGADAAQRERLLGWLRRVSHAALSAYGRLPLADVQVLVVPVGTQREAVVFGQSTRGQGHALTLFVDPGQPDAAFDRDWIAVHELSHLFHPYLGDRGAWLAEGLATYYQNVLRARAGLLTPQQAWAALDAGFARGRQATRGDVDLEAAAAQMGERHDFQRVYWSGTAYWLQVDADLRRASENRMSIDEALRRFDACCGLSERPWPADAFVAKLDALSGSDAFSQRFREYRTRRDFPDLKTLYGSLGIIPADAGVRLDDGAREASIRRAIMAPGSPASRRKRTP